MKSKPTSTMAFHELFATAEARGLDLGIVATALLQTMQIDDVAGRVVGLRRSWRYVVPSRADEREKLQSQIKLNDLIDELGLNEEDSQEPEPEVLGELRRLRDLIDAVSPKWEEAARDPIPRPVPADIWRLFTDRVSDSCTTYWDDDPEKPEQWASADLVSGEVETCLWSWNVDLEKVQYLGLRMDTALAELILRDPSNAAASVTSPVPAPLGEDEIKSWIKNCGLNNNEEAWKKFFSVFGDRSGKKLEFRRLWNGVRQNRRGRPRNN